MFGMTPSSLRPSGVASSFKRRRPGSRTLEA
jgi:hypothetical protein